MTDAAPIEHALAQLETGARGTEPRAVCDRALRRTRRSRSPHRASRAFPPVRPNDEPGARLSTHEDVDAVRPGAAGSLRAATSTIRRSAR
jgi:hypothetical protein